MNRDKQDKEQHDNYCDAIENKYRSLTDNLTCLGDVNILKLIKFYRLYGGEVIKQMHRDLLKAQLKVKIMKPTVRLISIEREDLKKRVEFLNREIKRKDKYIDELLRKPKVRIDDILKEVGA